MKQVETHVKCSRAKSREQFFTENLSSTVATPFLIAMVKIQLKKLENRE